MFSQRKTAVLPVIIILILGIFLPMYQTPVMADDVQGNTTFYFKNVFNLVSDPLDFDSSGLVSLSKTPPTVNNVSYYPPKLTNIEELTMWASYWLIDYLLNSEGLEDLDGLEDIFSGFELLLPNPLRIVESYEYTGNETIYLNGNVDFRLFFSNPVNTRLSSSNIDQVSVSIHSLDPDLYLTEEIGRLNKTIPSSILQKNQQLTLVIEDINYSLRPGQNILCAIELVPGDKKITDFVLNDRPYFQTIMDTVISWLENFENSTDIPTITQIVDVINVVQNVTEQSNLTKDDYAEMINSVISPSLIYDGADFPTSVTLPFAAESSQDNGNNPLYYLHDDQSMSLSKSDSSESSTISLTEANGQWTSTELNRNKIVDDASALLYVQFQDFIPAFISPAMSLVASLKYDEEVIATESQLLDGKFEFQSSVRPYQFTFDIPEGKKEIRYGEQFVLEVSLQNVAQNLKNWQSCTLYYDSDQYPSVLDVDLSETDNIQVIETVTPADKKIIANDAVIYNLTVTSVFSDQIAVKVKENTFSLSEDANWSIQILPEDFSIEANGQQQVSIICDSTFNSVDAYDDDPLMVTIETSGNTGYDSRQITAMVSEDAVTFDFEIIVPSDKEIIHGEQDTYQFIIRNNNTGLWPDGYNIDAVSDHGFNVTVEPLSVRDVGYAENRTINVTIDIPDDTEIETDTLEFIVQSKESGLRKNVTVNTSIIGANIFEWIYDSFDAIAEQLGFDEIFGDYAAHVVAAILFIILFFILIIMVVLLTSKYVELICLDRIKELMPGEKAEYRIVIRNPSKKMRSYTVQTVASENGGKWTISAVRNPVTIPPRQEKEISLIVSSAEDIEANDWTEITVNVIPVDRKKGASISLMATLQDGSTDLDVRNVFHWPKSFHANEKVSTSFTLRNKGTIKARKISVSLTVNGEEKNKVEDLDTPPGAHPHITLPWKAEKGKNDIAITVS